MESEQVDTSDTQQGGEYDLSSPFVYTKIIEDLFPLYLSYGMTAEQYWDGSADLVKYYRKKAEIERDRQNMFLWMQGAYIYEALLDVAPAYQAFSDGKIEPYRKKPIPFEIDEKEEEEREREKMEKMKAKMQAFASQFNEHLKDEGEQNG